MMLTVEAYLRRGQRELRRLTLNPRVQLGVQLAAWGAAGFFLSAARLGGFPLPMAMGAICA